MKPLNLTPDQTSRVHTVLTELAALLDEIGATGTAAHIGNPEWHDGPVVSCALCDWTGAGEDVHQAFLHGIGSGISPALLWEAIRRTDPNPEPIFPDQTCTSCGTEHPGQDCPQEALFQ